MFTSVHSAVAKLAVKLSARSVPPVTTPVGHESLTQAYNPKFHKELVRRLQAIKTRRHTVLARVQGVGLRALGKTMKSRTTPALSTSAIAIHEAFGVPHTVVVETLETSSGGRVLPRTRVYTYWDVDLNAPDATYDLYDGDHETEHGSATTAAASTVSEEDPSHGQSLDDVLAAMEGSEYELERRTDDVEYEAAMLDVVTDDDDHTVSCLEVESEGGSNDPVVAGDDTSISTLDREDGFRTAPSPPPSIFFCPPTSTSSLPSSSDESGTSTRLRYPPVLVHESESHEQALYSEFKAIMA